MYNDYDPFAAGKGIMGDNFIPPALFAESLGFTDPYRQCSWWLRGLARTLPANDELEKIKEHYLLVPHPPHKDDVAIKVAGMTTICHRMESLYRSYQCDTGWIAVYLKSDYSGTRKEGSVLNLFELVTIMGICLTTHTPNDFLFGSPHTTRTLFRDQRVTAKWSQEDEELHIYQEENTSFIRGIRYII